MHKILLKKEEIFDVIVNCYQTDAQLINKYHVTPGNLSDCVDRTVSDLLNNNVSVYKIEENCNLIGYFGDTNNEFLNGFFVLPNYRKNGYMQAFWYLVTDHFNNKFKTAVFLKNKPAVKFLKKNGCKLEEVVDTEEGIGYVFNYEVKKCH